MTITRDTASTRSSFFDFPDQPAASGSVDHQEQQQQLPSHILALATALVEQERERAERLQTQDDKLTEAEIGVMRRLLNPKAKKTQVAADLRISMKTLDSHLYNIYDKLEVTDIREAVHSFIGRYPQYISEMLLFYIWPRQPQALGAHWHI